jgi:preprotein translocase subunit SecG
MMDSGSPVLASIYFILLVFLGAFFLMNIILVIIITQYGNTKVEQRNKEAEEAANTLNGIASGTNNENTNSEKRENTILSSPGRGS